MRDTESQGVEDGGGGRSRAGGLMVVAAIAVLLLIVIGFILWRNQQESRVEAPPSRTKRIVVFPFENLGPAEHAYFASGVNQEITRRLAAVSGLRVIARTSAAQYERTGKTVAQIGGDLGVGYMLDGTVHRVRNPDGGEWIALSSQMTRIADSTELWSASYERPLEEIFDVQSDIARQLVVGLHVDLPEAERRVLEARPTRNMDAYDAYLLGLAHSWSYEPKELELAERNFERAVELDPIFALAHALLSENHSLVFHFRIDRSPHRLARARAAVDRALELAPEMPEAHRALGHYLYWGHHNYESALEAYGIAATGRPSDSVNVASIGYVQRRQGRWQEAVDSLEQAAELDPRSEGNLVDLSETYARMRRYADAEQGCRRAIELAPDRYYPYIMCAAVSWSQYGTTERSRAVLDAMPGTDPEHQAYYLYRQEMYERDYPAALERALTLPDSISDPLGEEIFTSSLVECECLVSQGAPESAAEPCETARWQLEQRRTASPGDPAVSSALGWTYALIGRKEEAVTAGQRAVELRPTEADAMAGSSHLMRLAKIYAWVGENDRALDTIDELLDRPGWLSVPMLRLDPDWDPLRDHPRFQALLRNQMSFL